MMIAPIAALGIIAVAFLQMPVHVILPTGPRDLNIIGPVAVAVMMPTTKDTLHGREPGGIQAGPLGERRLSSFNQLKLYRLLHNLTSLPERRNRP